VPDFYNRLVFAALSRPADVRPARIRQLAAIRRLQRACFGADGYGWSTLLGLFLSPRGNQLAAYDGDELAGFVAAELEIFDRTAGRTADRIAWIVTIGVLPKSRGRGIGTALLDAAESWMSGESAARSRLTVRPSNVAAIRLYERRGYARIAVRSRYYADGEDGWVMEKSLDDRA